MARTVRDGIGEVIRHILKDRGLSRLGDSFVNFVYSSAKSKSTGRPFGGRVPDKVLSRSLAISGIGLPTRLNHGERGDIVEGALAFAWSKNLLTLEEAVGAVERRLNRVQFPSRCAEDEASALAFSELFLLAMRRICGSDQGWREFG